MTDKEKELQAEAIAYYRKQIAELKKENAELEKDKQYFSDSLDKQIEATLKLQQENKKLEAQKERMKMCCNCDYWRIGTDEIRADNIPCHEHDCDCKGCKDWKMW